eukprot:756285_1
MLASTQAFCQLVAFTMCWCVFCKRGQNLEEMLLQRSDDATLSPRLSQERKEEEKEDNTVELKIDQNPLTLTLKRLQCTVLNQYECSITTTQKSKPWNAIHNWCFDTIMIMVYTLKLLLCCPCTFKASLEKIKDCGYCTWCTAPHRHAPPMFTCCSFYCCVITCGPQETRDDAAGLVAIVVISLLPFMSCLFWLLSIYHVIPDEISASEVLLPLITLTVFGKTFLYRTLSRNVLYHVIAVHHVANTDFSGIVRRRFDECDFLFLDGTIGTLHHDNMFDDYGDLKDCIMFILPLCYGLIHIVVRAVNRQYDECHWYCIYVVVVTFCVNFAMMAHLINLVGISFINELREYKSVLIELYQILIIDRTTQDRIALYSGQNCTKWFNLWCETQQKAFLRFQEYEFTLVAVCFVLLIAGIVIGYSIIFRPWIFHDFDTIMHSALFVSLCFIWIMFLLFLIIIMKLGYSFTSIENKQVAALRAQQTLIYNIISEWNQTNCAHLHDVNELTKKILYLGHTANAINSIIERISVQSLAPSILGVRIDKVFVLLLVSNIISFIPAIFRLV